MISCSNLLNMVATEAFEEFREEKSSMLRVALLSANLGGFEHPTPHVPQNVPDGVVLTVKRITDVEFPPRHKTMLPRLQMGIVKRFMWDFVPNQDIYVWVDSSVTLLRPDAVTWFLNVLGDADLALLPHPHRSSIREEYLFLKEKLKGHDPYLTSRYENELLDEQMRVIEADQEFDDDRLYASTAFALRDSPAVRAMGKEWFFHVTRYHALDQLSFPYVVRKSGCTVHELPGNLYKHSVLTYTRGKKR